MHPKSGQHLRFFRSQHADLFIQQKGEIPVQQSVHSGEHSFLQLKQHTNEQLLLSFRSQHICVFLQQNILRLPDPDFFLVQLLPLRINAIPDIDPLTRNNPPPNLKLNFQPSLITSEISFIKQFQFLLHTCISKY